MTKVIFLGIVVVFIIVVWQAGANSSARQSQEAAGMTQQRIAAEERAVAEGKQLVLYTGWRCRSNGTLEGEVKHLGDFRLIGRVSVLFQNKDGNGVGVGHANLDLPPWRATAFTVKGEMDGSQMAERCDVKFFDGAGKQLTVHSG